MVTQIKFYLKAATDAITQNIPFKCVGLDKSMNKYDYDLADLQNICCHCQILMFYKYYIMLYSNYLKFITMQY